MIQLPDFKKSFEYENNFYLTSDITRTAKFIAQYELFKMSLNVPGVIIECGVFKGSSLIRFGTFRELFMSSFAKKIIGFDAFGSFPETNFESDKKFREKFINDSGDQGIAKHQLEEVFAHKGINKAFELVEGDITKTVPEYVRSHPELKISLLNLDVDIYEPSVVVLEEFFPRISRGGVLVLDDYGSFPGETKAIDEYLDKNNLRIQRFPYTHSPAFIIKE